MVNEGLAYLKLETPKGWNQFTIGGIGELRTSSVDKKSNEDELPVKLINYMDVYRKNVIDNNEPLMDVTATENELMSSSVKRGDILFTPSSETPNDIGYSSVVKEDFEDTLFSYHLVRLRPNIKLDSNFLRYVFNATYIRNQFERKATGSTRFTLSLSSFHDTKFLLPPLGEQKFIGSLLSSVDEAIKKTEAIFEQIEELKKGLMQQLLKKGIGHTKFKKTEIGEIPEEWELVSLNKVILSLNAGVSVNSENRTRESDEKGILKTSAVTNRIFNSNEHKTILSNEIERAKVTPKKGHIIISRMNTKELVGASSYVDSNYDDLFLPDRLWQATIDISNVSTVWLSFVLTSPETRSRISEIATGTSGSMKNISKQAFLNLKIALPNKDEQEKIADILDSVDKKQLAERTKIAKLSTLKKGLMKSLLTGKVRVKVDEAEVTQV